MFKPIPGCELPPNDAFVWKYMDLTKFLAILEKEALFFPTIDTLRASDRWEGSFENFELSEFVSDSPERKNDVQDAYFPSVSEVVSKRLCASCWHVSPHESTAMWKLYLTANEGIAIRSSFGELKKCFRYEHPEWPYCGGNFSERKVPLRAGLIEYIDRANPPKNTNTIKQVMYKGLSLQHEKELRILAQLHPIPAALPLYVDEQGNTVEDKTMALSPGVLDQIGRVKGVYLPIFVESLIKDVYIAPDAPYWFRELLERIMKRYNLGATLNWTGKPPRY